MQRLVSLFAVAVSVIALVSIRGGATAASCPSDIRAAVAQACPCDGSRNHGHYMKCVRKQLRQFKKDGCDQKALQRAAKCENSSTCGRAHKPIVCCTKHGRAKMTAAKNCTARGGSVMSGVTSPCDAHCAAQ